MTIILETKQRILCHQVIEDLDSFWTKGRAMTMEQAVQLALMESV